VKDLRTGTQSTDPRRVLDGDINIRPGLRLAVHGRYNIYFRVAPTETVIVRVVHSVRNPRRLSFD